MTHFGRGCGMALIIPYQELLGNYDAFEEPAAHLLIIPYQELLGNYDRFPVLIGKPEIIPYQELLGNYDGTHNAHDGAQNYTIPRAIRELWPQVRVERSDGHYTIPRAIRELWQYIFSFFKKWHYTIPRAIRELWLCPVLPDVQPPLYHTKSY